MATAKAIRPTEVIKARKASMPDVVIEVFNDLITKQFDGHSAYVTQEAAVRALVSKGLVRNQIFSNGWLDVEDIFEKAGWKVKYDKPGFNESYDAYFEFSLK